MASSKPAIARESVQEIGVAPARGGGADFRQPVFAGHDFFVVQMATAFGRYLILDMDACDAGALIIPNSAHDIEFVAVTSIGVGDDRDLHGTHHTRGVGDHFGFGEQAEIRISVRH
jgi:hypothetical protein